jgi:hypothetical protein
MKRMLMMTTFVLFAVPAWAQQCLHGPGETTEESARRRAALSAMRLINTVQATKGPDVPRYLSHDELAAAAARSRQSAAAAKLNFKPGEELLPGWELKLDVTENGYWFMIKDTKDPCGFAFVSNQEGLIYTAEPIR